MISSKKEASAYQALWVALLYDSLLKAEFSIAFSTKQKIEASVRATFI